MSNTAALTKRKALFVVLLCAIALLLAIALRWLFTLSPSYDMSTQSGRQEFLADLGWQIDTETEEFRTVVVPESLDGIMVQYNKMQQSQGYDLNDHLGESCQQYSYQLTNYPGTDSPVYVTLYVQGTELIAGDIHTNSLNGFMHGLKTNKQ